MSISIHTFLVCSMSLQHHATNVHPQVIIHNTHLPHSVRYHHHMLIILRLSHPHLPRTWAPHCQRGLVQGTVLSTSRYGHWWTDESAGSEAAFQETPASWAGISKNWERRRRRRENKGGRRTKEEGKEEGGGRERQRRERVQAGKPEVKKIQEDRYREKLWKSKRWWILIRWA